MHNVKPRASSFAAELHCRNELPLTFAQANRLESVCAPTAHAILERSIFTTRELASRKLPREEKQNKNPSKQKNKSPSSEIRTDENGTGVVLVTDKLTDPTQEQAKYQGVVTTLKTHQFDHATKRVTLEPVTKCQLQLQAKLPTKLP
jgi:hypothetical protein